MANRLSTMRVRLIAIVAGFIAIVSLLEISFRIVSAFRNSEKQDLNLTRLEIPALDPSKEPELRILALGESTTAIAHVRGRRIDWPFQLNQLLAKAQPPPGAFKSVRVFNFGASGTSTPFLLRLLQEKIDVVDPHIIIAMMGVNNATPIANRDDFLHRHSHLFRFLLWGWRLGSCESCFGRSWPKATFEETLVTFRDNVNRYREDLKGHEIRDFESLAEFQKHQDRLSRKYQLTAAESARERSVRYLDEVYNPRTADNLPLKAKLTELATETGEESLKLNFLNTNTLHTYCLIGHVNGRNNCAEAVLQSIKKGLAPSFALLSKAWDFGGYKNPEFKELIRENGFYFNEKSNTYREIAEAYRSMAETARWRGILFVAMQYPGGTRDGLHEYFERGSAAPFSSIREVYSYRSPSGISRLPAAYRHVQLVDNENFNQIVTKENAMEYYLDFFARQNGMNFGHATEKGNALIAQNVFKQLLSKQGLIDQALSKKVGR